MQDQTLDELSQLATEVAERIGLTLYDLEFAGSGGNRTLRVFIDGQDGVSIDDCADFSRGFSLVLDANDIVPGGKYELEVSSPGLERRLRKPWHFEQAVDRVISVRTKAPLEVQKNEKASVRKLKSLKGKLISILDQSLRMESQGEDWEVELNNIEKANLVFEEPKKMKKKGK